MQHPNTSVSGKYLLPMTSYEESRIITTGSHKASQSTFTSYNELRTYRIVRKISDMKYLDFIKQEMAVIMDRDPAIKSKMEVFLYPSFWALLKYRKAHKLYEKGHFYRARRLSQKTARKTGIEIHPGATIGEGLFIDHGHGVVIGETAIIGDNVTLYQGVTLGGTGKEQGKRHPTLGSNIMIGAGAKVLGSVTIGDNCKIGAGSVVVKNVPANSTVVGVPGKIVIRDNVRVESDLDQIHLPDPVMNEIEKLKEQNNKLKKRLARIENTVNESRRDEDDE